MGSVKALQTDYEELLACNKMAVADLKSLLAYMDSYIYDAPDEAVIREYVQKVINVLEEDN